jgi:hypothetical protein
MHLNRILWNVFKSISNQKVLIFTAIDAKDDWMQLDLEALVIVMYGMSSHSNSL